MATVTLKSEVSRGKYGIVTVKNANGTLNRKFKITAAELAAFHASGKAIPPGVTKAEWEGGYCVVAGKDYETGDIKVLSNGSLRLKYAEQQVNGRFVESWLILERNDFTGTPPNITVTQAVLDNTEIKTLKGVREILSARIVSIAAGVIETR